MKRTYFSIGHIANTRFYFSLERKFYKQGLSFDWYKNGSYKGTKKAFVFSFANTVGMCHIRDLNYFKNEKNS